ncbi:MAG: hypothetical protein JWO82_2781 [Akkermansiaceae bacterium]|nr:hypothetical protein [Akkermansiaceae bacterium]
MGCCLLLAGASAAHAGAPLIVDDSGVHAPKEVEADFTVDGYRDKGSESSDGNLTLTTGLTTWLEGSMILGYGGQRERNQPGPADERDGFLDVTLGLKVPLLDSAKSPIGLALSSAAVLPAAGHDLGVDRTNLNLLVIATRDWNDRFSTDVNAGFNWATGNGVAADAEDATFFGVAARWTVAKPWMLFVETYAWLPAHAAGDAQQILRGGVQWQCSEKCSLSAALATGYGETQRAGVSLGVNLVF